MRNIWRLFIVDLRNATRNVIAIIVCMGLVIVPALYAWFNIAASWNPYDNTKSLKVAVANTDAGYKSDLIPIKVNVGETVLNQLRANDQLDWQFVSKAKALDGVKSGDYYAAIVIPKQFSADMMTLFSTQIHHAKLRYYINEKSNAIAPHITDKGADTVTTTINTSFAKTIGSVGLDIASSVLKYASSPQAKDYVANATNHVATLADQLNGAANQLDAYSGLLGASGNIIQSTNALLGETSDGANSARKALKQGESGIASARDSLDATTQSVNTALANASSSYDVISQEVDSAFGNVSKQGSSIQTQLNTIKTQVDRNATDFGTIAQKFNDLAAQADNDTVKNALHAVADSATQTQKRLESISTQLSDAATSISTGDGNARKELNNIQASIASAKASMTKVSNDYANNLRPQLEALNQSMRNLSNQTDSVIGSLASTISDVSGLSGNTVKGIHSLQSNLGSSAKTLRKAATSLSDFGNQLTAAYNKGDIAGLNELSSANPVALATLLAAPVGLKRIPIYAVANYGSAMTPFYTILSIWVGSIILVAMIKVAISNRQKAKVLGLKPMPKEGVTPLEMFPESAGSAQDYGLRLHQEYFGRYLFLLLLALCQGGLVGLGDLFYLKVQADHVFQFMLVCWLCAIVFSNIMYTLALSFGTIGKAFAVILLVMQVAGSGGTFPVELLPSFFQKVYPFLLFPHAIQAMHAAMAGSYGNEYWQQMGYLTLFLVPSLILGLFLRKPVISLNQWIVRNVESTKLM
ncbi:YhgE/Pip family protein [Bifidobacterium aquikefiri]|uniref:YhgE/Pip family protein n=1 Tax=Bifidobacterium aquikefiri TaxID=1653207 RepID=UPI0039EA61D8